MKKIFVLCGILMLTFTSNAQSLIASSKHAGATLNHNQRKIVRFPTDDIFVVFVDWVDGENVIKGVMHDGSTGQWNEAFIITVGYNPSLAIADVFSWEIHLLYETNDTIKKIKHMHSPDFINWSQSHVISDPSFSATMPVADIDKSGNLNIFWIEPNGYLSESLVYARIFEDSLVDRKIITTKVNIDDIAIANHLQYESDDLFFAIQHTQDSLVFLRSTDEMASFDTLYTATGRQPCITFNSSWESWPESRVRLIYIDPDSYLNEVEIDFDWNQTYISQIPVGQVEYVCVDNLAPPIGYSFIFMQDGYLFHGFSYGSFWNWCSIMESIYGSNISLPSVAYKHFSFDYVDFIWLQDAGASWEIYHMRDDKHIWTDIDEDKEVGKGFSITGFPNPFSEIFTINVDVDMENVIPAIEIYDSRSTLIKRPQLKKVNAFEYTANWDGTNEAGSSVEGGLYIILCSVGDKRTARKVVYKP